MSLLTIYIANISSYEVDEEALSSLREYALANNLFWAMAEGHACEISVSSLNSLFTFDTNWLSGSSQRHGERLQERW
jgi:hypothetical protein